MNPYTIERRAHRKAKREDPHNKGHGLCWFTLLPFKSNDVLMAWVRARGAQHLLSTNPASPPVWLRASA